MVIFILAIILLQGISGLFINDDIFTARSYNGIINKIVEAVLTFIHRNSFDFIIGAITLYIIAIIGYKKLKNKSLIAYK
jgi:cytochrome b